jgi:hypothetical protein
MAIAIARQVGEGPDALAVLASNLERLIEAEGHESDTVLTARGYLAEQYIRAGDGHAALAVLGPLVEDRGDALGPDHPDTLRSERMTAEALELIGEVELAIATLEELIGRTLLALGPHHNETISARVVHLRMRADQGWVEVAEAEAFAAEMEAAFEPAHGIHPFVRLIVEQVIFEREGEDPSAL